MIVGSRQTTSQRDGEILRRALRIEWLRRADIRVLDVLLTYVDAEHQDAAWPSYATVARELQTHRDAVKRSVKRLKVAGLISPDGFSGKGKRFRGTRRWKFSHESAAESSEVRPLLRAVGGRAA